MEDRHNEIGRQRVRETGMWLVSADVTGRRGNTHIGFDPTRVTSPDGETVAQVPVPAVADIG
jgi:hypothetical protein